MFEAFEAIRILNLPDRSDRRREMLAHLARIGLGGDERVSFFAGSRQTESGPFASSGEYGCYRSHLALLKEASRAGKRVLVLEDDCEFLPGATCYRLPDDWDIFYGGYAAKDPENLETSDIIGAHCMGYSPKAAAALADYLETLLHPGFEPDALAVSQGLFDGELNPPFDGAIVWFRRNHPEMKTVFAQLAVQRSSRSDIAPSGLIDRTLPWAASVVRTAKNWVRTRAE